MLFFSDHDNFEGSSIRDGVSQRYVTFNNYNKVFHFPYSKTLLLNKKYSQNANL